MNGSWTRVHWSIILPKSTTGVAKPPAMCVKVLHLLHQMYVECFDLRNLFHCLVSLSSK